MSGKIPEHIISEIRDRVSIKDVVEDYVSLKKDGVNFKGLCPFHQEKSPSFKVHEGKGIFKCFGCGESGNVFGFLMKKEGMSFREAAERLAGRAGIEIPRVEPTPEEAEKERDQGVLFAATAAAADFYHQSLLESADAVGAREYLKGRGFTRETAVRYQLGYSPEGWSNLEAAVAGRGTTREALHGAGLVIQGDRGFYDRFRGRLMFPIHDVQGRVRGFGGRLLKDEPDQPKYLNSPESPIFKKGSGFYGLYQAKDAVRRLKKVVVAEGYFDQIALDRAGIGYAVAALGTALTAEHARLLRRYAAEVFMVFDADEAGRRAALRSLEPFLDEGLSPRIVVVPEGKDPDEYLTGHSREDFERLLAGAPPLLSYFMDQMLAEAGSTPAKVSQAVGEIAQMIGRIGDQIERSMFSQMLSRKSGVALPQVQTRVRRPERAAEIGTTARADFDPALYPRAELELVRFLLHHPETGRQVRDSEVLSRFQEPELADLAGKLLDQHDTLGRTPPGMFLEKNSSPGLQEWISRVIFEGDPYGEKSADALSDLLHQVSLGEMEARLVRLRREIEQAQDAGDEGRWRALQEQQRDLLKQRGKAAPGGR